MENRYSGFLSKLISTVLLVSPITHITGCSSDTDDDDDSSDTITIDCNAIPIVDHGCGLEDYKMAEIRRNLCDIVNHDIGYGERIPEIGIYPTDQLPEVCDGLKTSCTNSGTNEVKLDCNYMESRGGGKMSLTHEISHVYNNNGYAEAFKAICWDDQDNTHCSYLDGDFISNYGATNSSEDHSTIKEDYYGSPFTPYYLGTMSSKMVDKKNNAAGSLPDNNFRIFTTPTLETVRTFSYNQSYNYNLYSANGAIKLIVSRSGSAGFTTIEDMSGAMLATANTPYTSIPLVSYPLLITNSASSSSPTLQIYDLTDDTIKYLKSIQINENTTVNNLRPISLLGDDIISCDVNCQTPGSSNFWISNIQTAQSSAPYLGEDSLKGDNWREYHGFIARMMWFGAESVYLSLDGDILEWDEDNKEINSIDDGKWFLQWQPEFQDGYSPFNIGSAEIKLDSLDQVCTAAMIAYSIPQINDTLYKEKRLVCLVNTANGYQVSTHIEKLYDTVTEVRSMTTSNGSIFILSSDPDTLTMQIQKLTF
ncbi:MAG: hypothetical protein UR28_C0011G0026 [Candidatus Peregrinibacteria bacterium GW2011_GWF2_33_10]|nr:MAG: hypothetical protein UR28_C0011G0026 [Candidatus Peregrinibacteria bacterium GW2011_GWF2_33_10]OGJ44302.1 MAG: hypothetical protein A2272_05585 [Candidatus Peregrinibacteria bacterium RIFOXYA12_FULL_33_12]OGJ44677.1 MAG: hypothetical protein A2263_01025 [Candidatus Peregrinibacteria bacterium RIFOXYA2_FULL_33_21]OGJ50411.1 MAG: hypothetical protein A2307_06085 [Candidatus Peregrinibacteria bacterium RIFOXYB2_FULL_33_20]